MVFHKPRLLTESLPIVKKVSQFDLHEIQAVKWQRTVDFNSELKNKLIGKHAAEKNEKLSDLTELLSMQFYKNYYIGLS